MFRLDRVRPAVVAEGLAEAQVRFPSVPLVFCETRPLAQEWAYRFLGAAAHELSTHGPAEERVAQLELAPDLPPPEPTPAEVRAWAASTGRTVGAKGRVPLDVWAAYRAANS